MYTYPLKPIYESEVNFKMNNFYYLSHGGPGSGRYPLGSGDRPYQKFEKSRRGISGYIMARKEKKAQEKLKKKEDEARRQKLKEEAKERKMEADKERVLRSGTASEVMKYQGKLTNKELTDAADRIRLEKRLNEYSSEEIKTTLDKLKKIQSYTNVSSSLAKDGIELWNSLASIYNVTDAGRKSPLKTIKR